jgi:hypothetical protein
MENQESKAVVNFFDKPNVPETQTTEIFNEVAQTRWLPSLSICYATSDSFKKRVATPGDFVLGGATNLGNIVELVTLDHRAHAAVIENNAKFISQIYHLSTDSRKLAQNTEYQTFLKQPLGKGSKLVSGMDLLVYLPKFQAFAAFWLKNTVCTAAAPIWTASGEGRGRSVSINTIEVNRPGKQWFNLGVRPTNHAVVGSKLVVPGIDLVYDIPVPMDRVLHSVELFRNPTAELVDVEDAGADDTTERPGR